MAAFTIGDDVVRSAASYGVSEQTVAAATMATFMLFVVWSFIWKGWALWIAARKGSKPWYIALLIVNTGGILEILYIYVFSKKKPGATEAKKEVGDRE